MANCEILVQVIRFASKTIMQSKQHGGTGEGVRKGTRILRELSFLHVE